MNLCLPQRRLDLLPRSCTVLVWWLAATGYMGLMIPIWFYRKSIFAIYECSLLIQYWNNLQEWSFPKHWKYLELLKSECVNSCVFSSDNGAPLDNCTLHLKAMNSTSKKPTYISWLQCLHIYIFGILYKQKTFSFDLGIYLIRHRLLKSRDTYNITIKVTSTNVCTFFFNARIHIFIRSCWAALFSCAFLRKDVNWSSSCSDCSMEISKHILKLFNYKHSQSRTISPS